MTIPSTAIDRIILFCAKGAAADVPGYLKNILARDSELAPVRVRIEAVCRPEYAALILGALPWLADEKFMPRQPKSVPEATPRPDAMTRLLAARGDGLPIKDFDEDELQALGANAARFTKATGGRPVKMVRLAQYDPMLNPFA